MVTFVRRDERELVAVGRFQAMGARPTSGYYTNYAEAPECRLWPGTVEGRPTLVASDAPDEAPSYFVLLDWSGESIVAIRDYPHARHVMVEAE